MSRSENKHGVLGEGSEPMARHHCPDCLKLTMAPLGQEVVSCSHCGHVITEERTFLRLYREFVGLRLVSLNSCQGTTDAEIAQSLGLLDSEIARTLSLKAAR